jgi:hypothetical protein
MPVPSVAVADSGCLRQRVFERLISARRKPFGASTGLVCLSLLPRRERLGSG